MKNLYGAFYRCVRICEENNIPIANSEEIEVVVNSRAKKRWGLCTKNPNGTFTIQISDRLLKDDVDEAASVGLGAGHIIFWTKAEDLPKTISINDVEYTVKFVEA